MALQSGQEASAQHKGMHAIGELAAADAGVFRHGDFTLIAQGLGAKYGKRAIKADSTDPIHSVLNTSSDEHQLPDKVDKRLREVNETSFLSDEAMPNGLESSVIQCPTQSSTSASSLEGAKGCGEQHPRANVVNSVRLVRNFEAPQITYNTEEGVEFHFVIKNVALVSSSHRNGTDMGERSKVTPKKTREAEKRSMRRSAEVKMAYSSVVKFGNMQKKLDNASLRMRSIKSPPVSPILENIQMNNIKGDVKESRTNLMSSGPKRHGGGTGVQSSGNQDACTVTPSQPNSESKYVDITPRTVNTTNGTTLVSEQISTPQSHDCLNGKNTKMETSTSKNPEKAPFEKSTICQPEPSEEAVPNQHITSRYPESMRASDGGSCKQCVEVSEPSETKCKDSVINPLSDIKKWSREYFRKFDPEVADKMAAFDSQERSNLNSGESETDTRFLEADRDPLVPVQHLNLSNQVEWIDFINPRENRGTHDSIPSLKILAQTSVWDRGVKLPSKEHFDRACWALGHKAATNIDRWIDQNVDIKHRYSMDMKSPGFQSGQIRPSGLLQNRLVHPSEMLFDDLEPDFNTIDWSQINIHPPNNRDQLSPFQLLQSSELCRQITLAPYLEKVAEVEKLREEARKQAPCPEDNIRADHDDNPWVPRANFYVRPARIADISQIIAVYNDWVRNSVCTKFEGSLYEKDFLKDFEYRKQKGLPFLVAATRSSRGSDKDNPHNWNLLNVQNRRARRSRGSVQIDQEEKIIGLVFADPYDDSSPVFRGVIEVKVFVSPTCLRLGVGMTLLDRIMTYLDPIYQSKRGTRFEFNAREDGVEYKIGPTMKVRKVLIDVLYSKDQAQDFTWKKHVLETKFGFHQAGFFLNLAEHDSMPVHMASFVRESFNRPGNKSMMYPGQLKEIEGIFSPTLVHPANGLGPCG